jgi:outer membrane protein OmpA-like peptidoglycan-associated protein
MPTRYLIALMPVLLLLDGCATVPNPFAAPAEAAAPPASASGNPPASAPASATTDPRIAALTGAGIAPLTGAAAGSYMDRQADELRTQLQGTGVSVTRVGNQLVLNLPADAMFDTGKAVVKPGFTGTLTAIGTVLKHFGQTTVNVYGYMDQQGSEPAGKTLSQRRAVAVATALTNAGADQRRFYIEGRGSIDPIATNLTDAGKAQNRRVEVQITPLG